MYKYTFTPPPQINKKYFPYYLDIHNYYTKGKNKRQFNDLFRVNHNLAHPPEMVSVFKYGNLLGYIIYQRNDKLKSIKIDYWYIQKSFTNNNIGTNLLKRALKHILKTSPPDYSIIIYAPLYLSDKLKTIGFTQTLKSNLIDDTIMFEYTKHKRSKPSSSLININGYYYLIKTNRTKTKKIMNTNYVILNAGTPKKPNWILHNDLFKIPDHKYHHEILGSTNGLPDITKINDLTIFNN